MAEIIGRDIEAGVAVEDTRGTLAPSMERAIRHVTAEVLPQAEHVEDDSTRGQLEDFEDRRVVQKWIEGDLEGPIRAGMAGYFLYNLYGSVSSSELETSGVYEHVFNLEQSIKHPSLSFFLKDGDVSNQGYNGAMVSSFELNAAPDDLVRFSSTIGAIEGADASSYTYSYETDYDFIGRDVSVKVAASKSGLSSANPLNAKEVTISWDPNVIMDEFVFGSYTPNDIYNAGMNIEVELTKNYTDSTFEDLYRNDEAEYMEIDITGDSDISDDSSSKNAKINVVLNKVKVTDWSRSGGSDEVVTEDVTLRGFYNASDDKQSEVTVQSKVSEYDVAPTS